GSLSGPPICVTPMAEGLFDFHRGSDLLQLLLHVRRLRLGHLLLDRLGSAVHEILGLLETQTGQLTHDLDDLDLLVARRVEHHVELGLLLGRRRATRRRAARRPPPRPPPPGAPTPTAAAADTPHFSCSSFESWAASSSVSESRFSAISSIFAAISPASCECSALWFTATPSTTGRRSCSALPGPAPAPAAARGGATPTGGPVPAGPRPAGSATRPSRADPPAPSARRAAGPCLPRIPA